jgi:predicted GNAT family acetyltransferase
MSESIQHDTAARRFTVSVNGAEAHLDYVMRDERTMDTTYTYTPAAARGRGLAGRLVEAALDHARAQRWRVVPSCWYVAGWIDRHPGYEDLLD